MMQCVFSPYILIPYTVLSQTAGFSFTWFVLVLLWASPYFQKLWVKAKLSHLALFCCNMLMTYSQQHHPSNNVKQTPPSRSHTASVSELHFVEEQLTSLDWTMWLPVVIVEILDQTIQLLRNLSVQLDLLLVWDPLIQFSGLQRQRTHSSRLKKPKPPPYWDSQIHHNPLPSVWPKNLSAWPLSC